jgi:WD40 repeat protein
MVAFSDDGSYLVAGADNLYLFSRSASAWAAPIHFAPASGDSVVSVAISGNGQWIVAGTFMGSVILLKNQSGALTAHATFALPNASVHWVAMSDDGSTFAVAASDANVR